MSVMDVLTAIVRGFGLLSIAVIGLAGLYGSAKTSCDAFALVRTPETRVTDLGPGLATVAGDARAECDLIAPLSGEPCVGFVLREWRSHVPPGGVNDAALDAMDVEWWEDDGTRERAVAEAVPFALRDATGELRVDPSGARGEDADDAPATLDPLEAFDLRDVPGTEATFRGDEAVPDALAAVAARHSGLRTDPEGAERWRYVETRIPEGDLTVTGRAVRRAGRFELVDGGTFVLSDASASATARHRAGVALVLLCVGIGSLALVAAGLEAWFGVSVPLLTVP